jgi:hypothetical protein
LFLYSPCFVSIVDTFATHVAGGGVGMRQLSVVLAASTSKKCCKKISLCSGWMRQLLALLVASALLDAPTTQVVKNFTTEQKRKQMIT